MGRRLAFAATAAPFGVLGALLNPRAPLGAWLFGPVELHGVTPTPAQFGLLAGVGIVEVVAFALGGLFLVRGRSVVRRIIPSPRLAVAAHLALAWCLMSWVPHDALHQTNGSNLWRLVAIEYAFHVTLLAAAGILVWSMVAACRIQTVARKESALAGRSQPPARTA